MAPPPLFFYISDITNSSSFNGNIFRKKSVLENFRANVLKDATKLSFSQILFKSNSRFVGVNLLKGLGYAILGNFSTDQMVIELTKI